MAPTIARPTAVQTAVVQTAVVQTAVVRPAVVRPAVEPAARTAPSHPAGRRARRGPGEPPVPSLPLAPREIARSLAFRHTMWRPLVRFTEPRFFTRVATGPGWEAWLLTWLPGQSTGLHDHGGSSGAFAVLTGSVDESLPLRAVGGPDDAARVRLTSRRYRAGTVRAFGSQHLHDVAARDGRRAVTLHVYAPRLTTMTRYDLVDGRLVVAAREQEGDDW